MSITLKKDQWKVKDPSTGTYRGTAIFSTTLPEDAAQIVEDATDALDAQQARAQEIVNDAQNAVNSIDGLRETMIANIASVAGQGTDSTLTQQGVAADAKATGNLKKFLMNLPGENDYGSNGQYPRSTGTGIEWTDYGLPSDEQTAEAIQDWLDNHPEATTTVQDGSLTEAKFTNDLKNMTLNDYITPEMFGAVGDGTTDDTEAINNTISEAVSRNTSVVFPFGKTYLVTETIIVNTPPKSFIMNGALKYTGSSTAMIFGNNNSGFENLNLQLNVIGLTSGTSYVAGSTGVKLINFNSCQIYIKRIARFETGIELIGDHGGFAYNNISIGVLVSCLCLLKLNNLTGGWVNENKFFNGRFQVYSSDSFKNSTVGILITSETGYYNNANTFYAPSLEQLATCVEIRYGQMNRFYDCRTEGAQNVLDISNDSTRNVLTTTYGSIFVKNNFNTINRWDTPIDPILQGLNNIIFDSGDISANCAANGTEVSCAKLVNKYYSTITSNFYSEWTDVSASGLLIKHNGMAGAMIDTNKNKTFLLSSITNAGFRYGVVMYDSNGAVITDITPKVYDTNGLYNGLLGKQGGRINGYITGANSTVDAIINIPNECVKAIFFVFGAGNNFTLKRFIIKAKYIDYAYTINNSETAVLSSIPTSTGRIGQIVKNASPSTGNIGWVYTGSEWIPFG